MYYYYHYHHHYHYHYHYHYYYTPMGSLLFINELQSARKGPKNG